MTFNSTKSPFVIWFVISVFEDYNLVIDSLRQASEELRLLEVSRLYAFLSFVCNFPFVSDKAASLLHVTQSLLLNYYHTKYRHLWFYMCPVSDMYHTPHLSVLLEKIFFQSHRSDTDRTPFWWEQAFFNDIFCVFFL
jgi:hypothetical protein